MTYREYTNILWDPAPLQRKISPAAEAESQIQEPSPAWGDFDIPCMAFSGEDTALPFSCRGRVGRIRFVELVVLVSYIDSVLYDTIDCRWSPYHVLHFAAFALHGSDALIDTALVCLCYPCICRWIRWSWACLSWQSRQGPQPVCPFSALQPRCARI